MVPANSYMSSLLPTSWHLHSSTIVHSGEAEFQESSASEKERNDMLLELLHKLHYKLYRMDNRHLLLLLLLLCAPIPEARLVENLHRQLRMSRLRRVESLTILLLINHNRSVLLPISLLV